MDQREKTRQVWDVKTLDVIANNIVARADAVTVVVVGVGVEPAALVNRTHYKMTSKPY